MSRLCSKRTLRGSSATVIVAALMLLGVESPASAQSAAVVSVTTDGDNITNSGTIDAPAPGSIGLWAEAQAGTSCGTNVVNVTGNITADFWAIIAIGCGSSTVNIEPGQTVTSSAPGTVTLWNIATTTAMINIDGTVAAPSDDEIALVQFGTSSVTTLNGSAVLRGRFIGGDGTDELTINNGATWFTAGESDFWTGSDVLNNSGTIKLTGDATFLNLEEFTNSGTLSLDGSVLDLPDLSSFINVGTIVLGTGTLVLPDLVSFTNSGTLAFGAEPLAPASAMLASTEAIRNEGGGATFTIDSMLSNSGMVSLANHSAGDRLTITKGYDGTGAASLAIDVNGAMADRLIVGGSTTGSTLLLVNKIGTIDRDRILVVETEGAAPGAFVLANPDVTQLIALHLEQSGGDFFLFAVPNEIAYQPLAIGNVAQDMWYESANAYSAYAALRRSDRGESRKGGLGLWGQLIWSRSEYGSVRNLSIFDTEISLDGEVEAEHRGAQAGVDYLIGNSFVVGLTGGYQKADADFRSASGGVDIEGYNLGAYAQFGNSTGFYGDVLAKVDRSDVRMTNSAFKFAGSNPDARIWGIGGEVGYRWTSGSVNLDVGGGLSHVRTKIDDFSAEGIDYDFDGSSSLRGRLGARAEFGGKLTPFIDARLFHEIDGDTKLALANGDDEDLVTGKGHGTWARLEAGIGARDSRGVILSGWTEFGDVKGVGVRAGFRF